VEKILGGHNEQRSTLRVDPMADGPHPIRIAVMTAHAASSGCQVRCVYHGQSRIVKEFCPFQVFAVTAGTVDRSQAFAFINGRVVRWNNQGRLYLLHVNGFILPCHGAGVPIEPGSLPSPFHCLESSGIVQTNPGTINPESRNSPTTL
jgi:hypothetical protein